MSGPFKPRGDGEEPKRAEPSKLRRKSMAPRRNVGGMGPNTTWIVGVIAVVFIAYVTFNTISTESQGSLGVRDGAELPPFTAPLALANLTCETDDGEEQPCDANVQRVERDGIPAACDARREGALNSCDLVEQGPVVVAFMAEPSGICVEQIDLLDRLAPRFPDVSFVAVAIKGDHEELNELIRERGWEIPVVYDHDGAIANAFAIAVCPTITFAFKGGRVEHSQVREASEAVIVRHLRTIQRGPRG